MCCASVANCGGVVLDNVAAVCQFSLQDVCCYMTTVFSVSISLLLDYGLLPILTAVNNATTNTAVQMSRVSAFSPFGYLLRCETAGKYGNFRLNFFEECP